MPLLLPFCSFLRLTASETVPEAEEEEDPFVVVGAAGLTVPGFGGGLSRPCDRNGRGKSVQRSYCKSRFSFEQSQRR